MNTSERPPPAFESYVPLITPVLLLIESPAGSPVAEYTIARLSVSVTPPALIVIGQNHALSLTVISVSAANAPPATGAGSTTSSDTVVLALALLLSVATTMIVYVFDVVVGDILIE